MINLKSIALVLLTLAVTPLSALEPEPEITEVELLKSWGFSRSAQGRLKFEAEADAQEDYQPWSPAAGEHQFPVVRKISPIILQPLVISSKHKQEP